MKPSIFKETFNAPSKAGVNERGWPASAQQQRALHCLPARAPVKTKTEKPELQRDAQRADGLGDWKPLYWL